VIQRFSFGHPFPTQSVVLSLPAESGPIPFLTPDGSGWQLTLSEQAAVYGLGEMPRGINKRGWHYIANNTDESRHSEDKLSFYGAHNFLLVRDGSTCFGLFVDFPGKVYYDIGYSRHDLLSFHTETPDYDLYLLSGGNENAICREFRTLIGRSYIPPRWAFGLAQSRWGYKTEEDVREVARQYKEHDLPLDMICMDIEYMQDYADFTVNKERFPDLTKLSADLKAQGIRLVPIIDAGVRVDPNDSTCTEGLEKGYFCKKADGTPFVAAVWPGKAYFADFLRPEVREWFGHKYKALTDCGIEGFWNDMNEPSLFYSPERLRAFLDDMAALREKDNIEQEEFFPRVVGGAMGLMNSPTDYASFYHEADGRKVRHDQVHNLYGGSMTRAAGEAFDKVGKMLGLPYPGGPEIDRMAAHGDPQAFSFPRALMKEHTANVSFSGLKTAVLYTLPRLTASGDPHDLPEQTLRDLCASFQRAVTDVLIHKALHALRVSGHRTLSVSGGVSCNGELRSRLKAACDRENVELVLPDFDLTTDNAAMIAYVTCLKARRGLFHSLDEDVDPNLKLTEDLNRSKYSTHS